MNIFDKIKTWAVNIKNYTPVSWDKMPEIDLYMDQVTGYLNNQLGMLNSSEDNNILTSNMINNYVKCGLIKRPEKKKYDKEQLASLIMICGLKQVLSIQNISFLLNHFSNDEKKEEYEFFISTQSDSINEVSSLIENNNFSSETEAVKMAVTLSLQATARSMAAVKILNYLQSDKGDAVKEEI